MGSYICSEVRGCMKGGRMGGYMFGEMGGYVKGVRSGGYLCCETTDHGGGVSTAGCGTAHKVVEHQAAGGAVLLQLYPAIHTTQL